MSHKKYIQQNVPFIAGPSWRNCRHHSWRGRAASTDQSRGPRGCGGGGHFGELGTLAPSCESGSSST
eukprot:scaffold70349_cov28-Prasinocladus_malaysianus.AAC.1